MSLSQKNKIALVVILHISLIIGCVSTSSKKASPEKIAEANANLATEYFRLNRIEESLSVARKAIKANADSLAANSLLALIYQRIEQPKQAEPYFIKALAIADEESSDFGVVYNNYGVFLCRNNRFAEADESFILAANSKFYKTPLDALENAGICALNLSDNSLAEKHFRKILDLSKNRPRSLFEMAKIQYENNKFLSSRAFLQRYHTVVGSNASSLYLAIKVEGKLSARNEVNRLKGELKSRFPESQETLALEN